MSFRCLSALLLASVVSATASDRILRVCADPNNLPFSNRAGEGLENRLAGLVAADLKAELKYTWWTQRESFLENSLEAGLCDVVMGVPADIDSVLTTRPYYHSSYVFVERGDRHLNIASLTDARLDSLKIGIHVVGKDYAPPAHLLARQGLASQIVGFSLYGTAGEPNPPSLLIRAVAQGDIDLAIIWGPFAGYFSKREDVPLAITPVSPSRFLAVPFTYGISAAVRKGDTSLRDDIEQVFTRECNKISALLIEYGIPQVQEDFAQCGLLQSAAASLH